MSTFSCSGASATSAARSTLLVMANSVVKQSEVDAPLQTWPPTCNPPLRAYRAPSTQAHDQTGDGTNHLTHICGEGMSHVCGLRRLFLKLHYIHKQDRDNTDRAGLSLSKTKQASSTKHQRKYTPLLRCNL